MIKGKKIELVLASMDDKQRSYEWCFQSETTKYHAGPPNYPEVPIATQEEYFRDTPDYFFTGSEPEKGQGFLIMHEGEAVGFITYSSFHVKPHKSELDIWMNREANCGKGLGTDAILALGDYLNQHLGIDEIFMRPSVKNKRAIASYQKAGLIRNDAQPSDYLLDEYLSIYGDGDYGKDGDVLLVKRL